MKPAPFKYFSPETLDEALALKSEYGDDGKVLAGGQSLIPAMNFRLAQPSVLIDLNRIAALQGVVKKNGSIHIKAMTRQSAVEKDNLVKKHNPLLFETMPHIAHPQIRNRGTIGGSLAHADPASELPVIAFATAARFRAQSEKNDRWLNSTEFFQGMFYVGLQDDEILTEIEFPNIKSGRGWSFLEIARRKGDYAMAGLAATIDLDEAGHITNAQLIYLNVGEGPVIAKDAANTLEGKLPIIESFSEAAKIASAKEIQPFGNVHASPEYQRHLSNVLTQRALEIAATRAKAV
jgi:carbon-monoxide dehydrogenase medium subunit